MARPKKNVSIGTKVDAEIAAAAKKKADKQGRSLSAVIRSFLTLWASDEWPAELEPPRLPGEGSRAPGAGRPEGAKDKKPRKRRAKPKKRE